VSLVLALEPDPKQAAVLKQVVRDRVGAQFVLADSKDAALAAITERVPDLILVTTLLSPRDESELTDRLRDLEGAEHLQTLTIPLLAVSGSAAEPKKKRRGLLSAFTSDTEAPAAPSGCDPAVFADEIRNYIARAEDLKATASVERERKRVSRKKKSVAAAEPSLIVRPADAGPVVDSPAPDPAVPAIEPVSGPQGSYWAWEHAAPATAPEPAVAEPVAAEKADPEKPLDGGYSSWDNPWDVSKAAAVVPASPVSSDARDAFSTPAVADSGGSPDPAPEPEASTAWSSQARAALEGLAAAPPSTTYLDDHVIPDVGSLPIVAGSAIDALLERPSQPTAADLLADAPLAPGEEIDLSELLDDAKPSTPAATPATGGDVYRLPQDAFGLDTWLDRPVIAPIPEAPAMSEADRAAMTALQADVERLRADRQSVESALAEARAAQERAEAAAADATQRARDEIAKHRAELAARARQDAAAEYKARERDERKSRDEADRRMLVERQAREEFERLTREVEARVREEAAAERRLRERAESAAREAEAARAKDAAERELRESADRLARAHAEAEAASERRAREHAEARANAERQAREDAEQRAREHAERVALEAEERRLREAADLKAREEAERKARQDAEARAAVERKAREEVERKAREHAEALARAAEERRAKEAAELKAREEAERKGRQEAEARAAVERKAREAAEQRAREHAEAVARDAEARQAREAVELKAREDAARQAQEEAEARVEVERQARKDAERQAKLEASRRAEMERKTREEAERLAEETAARAREEARAERKARVLAERRAAEERKAREQAERRAREEASRRAAVEARAKQDSERRAREASQPKKAVIVKKAKRRPAPEPVRERTPKKDQSRPTQDEWGLYDPDKAGFGALFAKLDAIDNGELVEDDPSAADLLAATPDTTRSGPRPLSMWAWRADSIEPAAAPALADDFRGLVDRLNIPAAVAAVRYASGVRIRRVTITPGEKPARGKHDDSRVIILSRKMLKAVRAESDVAPERSDTRRIA
jgi:CheY-like chemotaxis protein